MLRALKNFCRRPSVRFGLARDSRGRLRDPQFVSFVAQNNRKVRHTDFHDTVLRSRKFFKRTFVTLLAGGGAWVVLESARALSAF